MIGGRFFVEVVAAVYGDEFDGPLEGLGGGTDCEGCVEDGGEGFCFHFLFFYVVGHYFEVVVVVVVLWWLTIAVSIAIIVCCIDCSS